MMFWKFQTQRADAPEAQAPVFVPAAPAQPQPPPAQPEFAPPVQQPEFAPPAPVPAVDAQSQPSAPQQPAQPPTGYEQAAERTMRFLSNALGIPTWVLFKNQSGTLSVVSGIGDYEHHLPSPELAIGRLSDLQTINLLGATPPMTANGGMDRRQGGVDPATVAPFGVPLVDAESNLFGILCALGERAAADRAAASRALLDYAASMLGAVVRSELTLEEATRRTERAQADALVDPLTGLHNRRAWDQLLATEDQRCSRHGYDAVVFVIDLDGLKATNDRFGHEKGDELIKNAATALERCVRRTDVVARVGGDEFSILAVKCDANAAARIREHIESTLLRANAPATVGFAVRSEAGDLFEAWRQADGAMYHRKRGNPRRGQRATDEQPVAPAPAPAGAPQPVTPAPAAPVAAQAEPEAPAPQPAPQPQAPAPPPEAVAPPPQPAPPPSTVETSVVTQILEKVLPALVSGVARAAAPPPPPAPPQPVFAPPQTPTVPTRPLIVQGEAQIPTYTPPPPPAPEPAPVAAVPPAAPAPPAPAAPVPEPAPAPAPQPEQAAQPQPSPQPEPVAEPPAAAPQPAASQPSEDLIDIVSRLSRLSDADRRLLDVFFKGSR